MSLPRFSTRRPVAIAMLFLAVALLGVISFVRLPIDLLPDLSYPKLVVYTSYPDVAPAEVERLVTERVEAEAAAVPEVEQVTSVSREGVSLVTLRFQWGTDMDFALLNARERMDNLRGELPETASRPRLLRVDPESEPVMVLSVTGPSDLWETKDLAESVIRRRIEQLDGVARALVTGGLDREIEVQVEPELLRTYGLTPADVARALAGANVSAPGGTIIEGRYRYPLRTLGEFRTVEEIADVVLTRQAPESAGETGFRLIRLADVATVVDGFEERDAMARLDGEEAVGLLLFKEAGANTVAVAEDVREVVGQLRAEYPAFRIAVASSQAGFIASAIGNLAQEVLIGGLLAFLMLFFFLRDPRYPVVVAAAIPASVLATFVLLEVFGVSLNIMSLGGLALGVGMLVDNSIVVLENIFRHRELGKDALEAASAGAEEVTGAITASTLTTIGVFAPIVYVEGVAGELFGDLAFAVAFSLLASLLVALTLLPAWAARFDVLAEAAGRGGDSGPERAGDARSPDPVGPAAGGGRQAGPVRPALPGAALVRTLSSRVARPLRALGGLGASLLVFWLGGAATLVRRLATPLLDAFDRGFARFTEHYHGALTWGLDRPWRTLGWSAAALAASLAVGWNLRRDLLPDVDQGAFDVRIQLAEGADLAATAEAAATVEEALLADPGVEAVFSRIGREVRAYGDEEERSDVNGAFLRVRVAEGASTSDVVSRARPVAGRLGGASLALQEGQATTLGRILGGEAADLAVRVRGEDLDAAHALAEEVAQRLARVDRLANVRLGTERGTPELRVQILRDRAAAYGIDPGEIAEAVDEAMRGRRATEYVDFDRKIAVMVRYPDELRHSRATLETLRVGDVPLRELVRVEEVLGPAEVRREDQGRLVSVYADVVRGGLDAAVADVEAALGDLPARRGLRVEVGGENEEMRRSFRGLLVAFLLASLLVYMVLAAQFESFAHPFTILMAVPLSLVGAVLALLLTGGGVNTMSLIGLVILVGIVDNDAIVKVDFINQARARGAGVREAILEAGRKRLRPIVMTTVTTALGLLPMALGLGSGGDLQRPLAIVVIGGLAVATLLTLVVIPVIYMVIEQARTGALRP